MTSAYLAVTARRLSFMVGVISSPPGSQNAGPRPAPDLAVLRQDRDAAGLAGLDVRASLVTASYRPLPG